MTAEEDANRALVIEAFDTLFNRRDYTRAEAFWSRNAATTACSTPHAGPDLISR